ncbi:MAG: EAL domain-containing protein [Clostridia bacterium]|nr:EAL domain-containing protein [Clostridia bacterium]
MKAIINKYLKLQDKIIALDDDVKIHKLIHKNLALFELIKQLIHKELKANNFQILYQPHIFTNGKIVGAEALFRLFVTLDGERIKINPFVLFAIANYYNLEEWLSIEAFKRVAADAAKFKKEIDTDFIVSYNLNPQFLNEKVCDQLIDIIDKNTLARKNIALELVEFYGLKKINPETMQYYKKRGMRFYLDDFGSGYSDHKVVNRLPFDVLKFSGSIIIGIDKKKNKKHLNFVRNTIKICKERGISTIAEHVETQSELEIISELGVTAVQGFVFDKLLSADELIEKYSKSDNSEQ